MPYLPRQLNTATVRLDVNQFGGYRHDHRAGPDRFYDMQNMSSDAFPLLRQRKKRKSVGTLAGNANGICAKAALCWADGPALFYDGAEVGEVADSPKQFVGIGSKIIIWPDKLAYDVTAGTLTPLGASFSSDGESTVTITLCESDGAALSATPTVAAAKPATASTGDLWIDTSDTPHTLKKYSANTGRWTEIPTVYLKVAAAGIGVDFAVGDGVTISGCSEDELNASYVLQAVDDDYIVIIGLVDATITQTAALTVERNIPEFDYICEHNNRVWGCSNARHEIACCKLGDPTNWSCFQGISTDSYTLTIGGDGNFTGCCAYGGNVVFFKAHTILKILGNKPENFTLSPVECNGVAPGSAASLVVANETLYYYSPAGICAYSGALPTLIGEDLGGGAYASAVAGATASKYYVSMQDADNDWHLFAFDTRYGIWHREDDTQAVGFARLGSVLHVLTAAGAIMAIDDDTGTETVEFMFETGELIRSGYAYAQRLILRLEAERGTRLRTRLSYDGGSWQEAGQVSATRKRPVTLPLRLRRCDSLRLRIEGSGEITLHEIKMTMIQGGEGART